MTSELKVVALYPVLLNDLLNRPGVRTRRRKDQMWTQVECNVVDEGGRSLARPIYAVPSDVPMTTYRFQLKVERSGHPPRDVIVPLQPRSDTRTHDPEQRVLAPIYNAPHRLVFEFERAEVFHLTQSGDLEVRLVAVDRQDGAVGTRTLYRFHSGYAALAARCSAHLSGSVDLFPPPTAPPPRKTAPVPQGEANLLFGSRTDKTAPDQAGR